MGSKNKVCPSSTCHSGALLLGVVQGNQKVAFLDSPLPINESFIEIAQKEGEPEKRFRFADKCIQGGCKQWTGKSCGIMDELSAANPTLEVFNEQIPKCAIRPNCRWYSQEGKKACAICPLIITDSNL